MSRRRAARQFQEFFDLFLDLILGPKKKPFVSRQTQELQTIEPIYEKQKSILTDSESVFYKVLIKAVGSQYQIFAKVRLADFVWLVNESETQKYHLNQILGKHVDFLLCDNDRLSPMLCIELDDKSHQLPDHQERDNFKNKLFESIQMPLLRVKLQNGYSVTYLNDLIEWKLKEIPVQKAS